MIKNKYYVLDKKYHKKIALLSDLHLNIKYDYDIFLNIINDLKKNKPDYICIPGDIIDDNNIFKHETLKNRLYKFFENLGLISKVIISIGNHEKLYGNKYKENHNKEFFDSLNKIKNVYVLDNENFVDNNINFIGFNPSIEYYKKEKEVELLINDFNNLVSKKLLNDKYNILLCHSPISITNKKMFENTNIKEINLILSGHMHNGLVFSIFDKIKNNYGLVGPNKKLFPSIARGILKKQNTTLVITGGVVKLAYNSGFNKFNKIFSTDIDYIDI